MRSDDTDAAQRLSMKRTVATIALMTALAVLLKLTFKSSNSSRSVAPAQANLPAIALPANPADSQLQPAPALLAKYQSATQEVRELVARVTERFGQNAHAIELTDGLRGLELLDRLDMEALFIYERHPAEFRRLRNLLGSDAAADLL